MSTTEIWPDASNVTFVEEMYWQYLDDPQSVPADWQDYFQGWASGENGIVRPPAPAQQGLASTETPREPRSLEAEAPTAVSERPASANGSAAAELNIAALQDRVDQMIRAYRVRGHMIANLDPLGLPRPTPRELELDFYGFAEADLDRPFSTRTIQGAAVRTLRGIIERLRSTYCRSIGVQFMHIDDYHVRQWLLERMEGTGNHLALSRDDQLRVLARLTDAAMFEEFLQKKYVGAKRFSLEGAETLIPALDMAIEKAGAIGVDSVILGMAHRGRINVLANIMGKSPNAIFREFDDPDAELHLGGGDVKYHLGFSNDWMTSSGRTVHLSLCFNPSHLEFVNPVAQGRMRAKQDRMRDAERDRGLVILIHGDASFVGEGVVAEALNLSQLEGYATGGTLHIVVNNQIGFTTNPRESRSNTYCTAMAKMLQIPIFHVNGEDPEAVAQCVHLALDFRQTFKRDVVIDMYCYRRYGHNEGDEPAFTQPMLYRAIENRKSVREGYCEHLLELGEVTRAEADAIAESRRKSLMDELSVARSENYLRRPEVRSGVWTKYYGGPEHKAEEVDTHVERPRLEHLLDRVTQVPKGFQPHNKIERWLNTRREMAAGKTALDWSAAEALALATLATEGHPIRISGQDSQRGTFSQRHAVLHDVNDGRTCVPLANLSPDQARVEIINSPLSEAGVLGFDYGYSLDAPDALVIWEAQFGDFVNVAQVIIDQFIASAEDKWRRLSGLVMLLPHGFEGMGPEHSSARLERFLSLCAEDNMQVAQPTTPAQYFHLLRRQVICRWRKPLIVMTPKSLLRHPAAVSPLEDMADGTFHCILPDTTANEPIERVVACSGKIYYELDRLREKESLEHIAIVRLEQLYPLTDQQLAAAFDRYPDETPIVWAQDEPRNMGAWPYLRLRFGDRLLDRFPLRYAARAASASPATGSASSHRLEQERLLHDALGIG